MRLGDLDALKEAFDCVGFNDYDDYKRALRLIDNTPTVAVDNYSMGYQDGVRKVLSERPQGKWIETRRGLHVTDYKCSCCGRTVRDDTGYNVANDYPFCHCGADMRGEKE